MKKNGFRLFSGVFSALVLALIITVVFYVKPSYATTNTIATQSTQSLQPTQSLHISLKSDKSTTLTLTLTLDKNTLLSEPTAQAVPETDFRVLYFVQTSEFQSKGWMQIGASNLTLANASSIVTNTISYNPTWTGKQNFRAEVVSDINNSDSVIVVVPTAFNVLKDPSGFPVSAYNYQRPLTQTGGWLVKGLLTLVACVWILMFGVLLVVSRRISQYGKVVDNG